MRDVERWEIRDLAKLEFAYGSSWPVLNEQYSIRERERYKTRDRGWCSV